MNRYPILFFLASGLLAAACSRTSAPAAPLYHLLDPQVSKGSGYSRQIITY